ncbi:hypothetical protein EVAR_32815_1 [Eumeta japonica]|uniref:Uncharacterized protein n=1 Tax=Eumeta variegata TaxID=151549 RepID=A0A4C1WCJ2_EUMVA|nr:hypothetical protein EVAR_32815_1 [Eumeta japonica]
MSHFGGPELSPAYLTARSAFVNAHSEAASNSLADKALQCMLQFCISICKRYRASHKRCTRRSRLRARDARDLVVPAAAR